MEDEYSRARDVPTKVALPAPSEMKSLTLTLHEILADVTHSALTGCKV